MAIKKIASSPEKGAQMINVIADENIANIAARNSDYKSAERYLHEFVVNLLGACRQYRGACQRGDFTFDQEQGRLSNLIGSMVPSHDVTVNLAVSERTPTRDLTTAIENSLLDGLFIEFGVGDNTVTVRVDCFMPKARNIDHHLFA